MSAALLTDAPATSQPVRPAAGRPIGEMVEADLLLDASALAERLAGQVAAGHTLDAFLLAAALNQVAEDYQHRDAFSLSRVAGLAARSGRPRVSAAVRWSRAGVMSISWATPGGRRLETWQGRLATLVEELAAAVIGRRPAASWATDAAALQAGDLHRLPAGMGSSVLRLPSCFRVLDLRPEDSVSLARRVLSQLGVVTGPLVVVGIRTSGSYLAPLLAASLRELGARSVEVLTVRPGVPLLGTERRGLRAALRRGATAVICDDPPASGVALERAADALVAQGFSDPLLAIPLLEGLAVPERLNRFRLALLPAESWHITAVLEPEQARIALQSLLPDHRVLTVERHSLEQPPDLKTEAGPRRHRRALYRADLLDGLGRRSSRQIYARGVGLGWLGRQSLATSEPLSDYHPPVLGIRDGVLYREWMPEECRLLGPTASEEAALARRVAGYVSSRSAALPASADKSRRLAGRQPVWQRVADLLGRGFGRARPLARVGLHRAARTLLHVEQPSVVDASMAMGQWFRAPERATWVKVDYDERAFSNEDLSVYDPLYDLAVAIADAALEERRPFADQIRREYEALTECSVDVERLTLYQLQHLTGLAASCREHLAANRQAGAEAERIRDAAEAAASLVMIEYLARRLLADVELRPDGPLCAIDIDGVLETSWLGFSCPTPLGVLVIRSLIAHGYRPVLASGRSLPDVTARSVALGLAGGVAEYGAAIWAGGEVAFDITDAGQIADLAVVRNALFDMPGLRVDSSPARVVRAYTLDGAGRRRGLTPDRAEQAIKEVASRIRHVPGWAQSDFVPEGIDKAAGLRRLLHELGRDPAGGSLAFAAGDTAEDGPMLAMAGLGAFIDRPRHQAGLARAAAALIGHRPGGCRQCRRPQLDRNAHLLMEALSAQDASRAGRPLAALRLAMEMWP